MKQKRLGLVALLLFVVVSGFAARVDTIMVESPSMNKKIETLVIVPDMAIDHKQSCPVVYLLHGYSGNAYSWMKIKPNLPNIADEKGLIFVCPNAQNSWYWDSPKNSDFRYETFVSSELITYIDRTYSTIPNKKGRAITGLSMGGHGALFIGMRHSDLFAAIGSTSGGVDIRPFPLNWEMAKQLGEYAANRKVWDEHTVVNQLDRITNGDVAIIVDCGEDDFFLNVNKDLHHRLVGRKIDHDFILRPGTHNAAYWSNSIDYQILFFRKVFTSALNN